MNKLFVNIINGAVLLKQFLGETLLLFKKYIVRSEYGEIVNASEILNGIYEIYDFWN